MDLSIIIVNYRGWKHLSECLNSLAVFHNRTSVEVIIVDNNSADGRLDEFRQAYPGFVFINSALNGGFAYGCNLGRSYATGDFFLFLNPDTVADQAAVEKLFERAKANPANFISTCSQVDKGGKVSKAYGIFPGYGTLTGPGRAVYRLLNKKKLREMPVQGENFFSPDWVSGSVMMTKKEDFDKINGFDEDYWMYFEDTDICKRARSIGGNIICFTDLTILHNHGGSSRINLKTTSLTKTEVMISNHLYISKHKTGTDRFLLQTWLIVYNLIAGLFSALSGLLLFFKPKMLAKSHICFRLIGYYFGVLKHGTWKSPRSVNFYK